MHLSILIFSFLTFNLQKDWYKVETEHFTVYYHSEIKDFAKRAVDFLETKAYPHISEVLKFKPERKINIVFGDFDDIGNGLALEIFNQVIIFTADIYFIPLRGRHPWLEDVIVHELTHIFALKKVKKMPDAVPSVSISGGFFCVLSPICKLSNIDKKATVVGGFVFSSIPYSEPAYFTEGIAQLVTAEIGYDSVDTYRDMIIRTLLYHDKLYPLEKLGNFEGKAGFEGEIVYNHGFSFLTFIKEKYGWDAILKVMDYSSEFFSSSYQKAFEYAVGKDFKEIEAEWKNWLKEIYQEHISRYEKNKHKVGKRINLKPDKIGLYEPQIYFVYQPRPYKDGILLIQDRNLVFYDKEGNKQVIAGGVQSYSVQGTQIAISYPKPTKKFVFLGSFPETYMNLAVGYLVEEDQKLVVKNRKDIAKRASFPSFSPDGKKVIFVRTESDSRNLFIYDFDEKKEKRITNFKDGKQFVFPNFSPDGRYIVAAYFDGTKQDIVIVDSQVQEPIGSGDLLKFITYDNAEDRDPVFVDNDLISFASDKDGVFNIYVADLKSKRFWRLTEEISGTLFPYPISRESFVYVAFEPEGFRLKILQSTTWEDISEGIGGNNYRSAVSSSDISTSAETKTLGKEAPIIDLSSPIFIPSLGLTLTPLLTSSSTDFFIPLDIFGFSLDSFSFDVIGRMQVGFRGFLGMRGSLGLLGQVDSFHFEYIIPSLLVGFSRYKATPITNLQGLSISSEGWTILNVFGALPLRIPVIYGTQGFGFTLFLAPVLEYYKQEVKTGGLTYLPFGQTYSSVSRRLVGGFIFSYPFKLPGGRASLLLESLGSVFSTSVNLMVEQFDQLLFQEPQSYFTGNIQISLGASYSLPIGFEKSFSVIALGRGGYTFRNVSSIDEFVNSYPGYLQVFFGDMFVEANYGTVLDLWSGYLNITDTSAIHKISIGSIYSVFGFIRQDEDLEKPVALGSVFRAKYFSSLSFALLTSASIFYRYNLTFQFIVSKGFQDPLKAPFRIYFGVGLGF